MEEQREQRVSTLSTGQRQMMNFARGLLNDPWIFFLDEPTLGLDVSAARSVRELVQAWKAAVPGRTILLTTHYMAEADELCDRIAIVDHGRILALGTPDELKRRVQRESVFRIELDRLDGGVGALRRLPGVVSAAQTAAEPSDGKGERHTIVVSLALVDDAALGAVVGALAGLGAHILALRKSEPSLEDVFVELVGRGFHDESDHDRKDSTPRDRREPPASDPTDDAREREAEVVA
jgi:ABC-2 type transport system ATP-binding protein